MSKPAHLPILHAPCHGPTVTEKELAHALSLGAVSVGLTEAYEHTSWLQARPRFRCLLRTYTDHRRGGKDNPILTRRYLPDLGSVAHLVAPASTPAKIAPERVLYASLFGHPVGGAAHLHFHNHAAIQGKSAGTDRVAKAFEAMRRVEGYAKLYHQLGLHVVVTGDFNETAAATAAHAPGPTFHRLGFETWHDGLDWMAWSPNLRLIGKDTIGEHENGQDHPWLLGHFAGR